MNAASLPYTVLMLLVELAVGSLAVVTLFDGRGMVTRGYVQLGSLLVLPLALLALWSTGALGSDEVIGGYALQLSLEAPAHRRAVRVESRCPRSTSSPRSARGAARPSCSARSGAWRASRCWRHSAALVALPAWSYVGMFASMLAAALVLGGALMAMSWGHWYLTNAGLPKEPLEQMALLVLGALMLQLALVLLAAVLPVRVVPLSASFGEALGRNPAFWLRVGVGLLFPLLLATLAWRAATIRGMMSATGPALHRARLRAGR